MVNKEKKIQNKILSHTQNVKKNWLLKRPEKLRERERNKSNKIEFLVRG